MMEEPILPTPDGKVRLFRRGFGKGAQAAPWWDVYPFSEMRDHGPNSYGWQINREGGRLLIPWHEIIEVDLVQNTEQYQELKKEYDELLHLHHIHEGLEYKDECLICLRSNFLSSLTAGTVMEMPPEHNRDKPFWS